MEKETTVLAGQKLVVKPSVKLLQLLPDSSAEITEVAKKRSLSIRGLAINGAIGFVGLPLAFSLFYVVMSLSPSVSHIIGDLVSSRIVSDILSFLYANFLYVLLFFYLIVRKIFIPVPTHLIIRRDGLLAFSTTTKMLKQSMEGGLEVELEQVLSTDRWTITEGYLSFGHGFLCKVRWSSLAKVSVKKRRNNDATLLSFQLADGRSTKLRLGDVLGHEARLQLLAALRDFAPQAQCDPEVYELLQPSADSSYTELWFSALSAPPSRERLLPLSSGITIGAGKYEVCEQLGSGGQGSTYIAKLTGTNSANSVVIKEYILPIHVTRMAKKAAIEELEHEVRLLQALDSSQIVKVVDFFVEDQRGYLVLEHIRGANLRNLVTQSGPLPEAKVRAFMKDLCNILIYLHAQNPPVIHRDFTPDNLILSDEGVLKLVDFNIAQQEIRDGAIAMVAGKRAYMPPEQFKGKCVAQSDLYALGATAYFLLTGEDPEPLESSHPREKSSTVSQSLNDIIARCTLLSTDARYQSAADILTDLST